MTKIKRGVLWSDPTADRNSGEMEKPQDEYEKIANDLADKIAEIITNGYANRDIVKNLIASAIKEQIRQYLREYDNVVAEDILNSLKGWKLGEIKGWMSEIDFEYARHGKLSTFGDELKKHFEKLQDESALHRVKKRIMALNTEPLKTAANGDGTIWKSNVLTIIDEELNPKKEEPTSDREG
jgi:hypothetical protein